MEMRGAIVRGSLAELILSLGRQRARALLVTRRQNEVGLFHFIEGALSSAELGPHVGASALQIVSQWTDGEYAIYERLPEGFTASAFVSAHDDETNAKLMQWLGEDGFFPQLAPWPEVAMHVVQYVQPALIIKSCPAAENARACQDMRAMMQRVCRTMPLVVLIKDGGCGPDETPCLSKPLSRDALEDLLEDQLLSLQPRTPDEVTWGAAPVG